MNIANAVAHAVDYVRHDAVDYVRHDLAEVAKDIPKSLGISPTELVLIGVGVLVGLFMLKRLMIPVKL